MQTGSFRELEQRGRASCILHRPLVSAAPGYRRVETPGPQDAMPCGSARWSRRGWRPEARAHFIVLSPRPAPEAAGGGLELSPFSRQTAHSSSCLPRPLHLLKKYPGNFSFPSAEGGGGTTQPHTTGWALTLPQPSNFPWPASGVCVVCRGVSPLTAQITRTPPFISMRVLDGCCMGVGRREWLGVSP